ncbi:class I SAM-dependent methyltransferase [Desertihabitans aurantiacus]|uniref:class I SAM-dependent methyltransferase n=1 Tax=Desertihabitans aurantiacus TaxID=2282477 RepID=UPI001E52C48C|nr:class I SAM-dependent methyltransferase [Desertihabitans aurantiacus]
MTIYQHPLAYLLGMEGLALLRGWAGDLDERFTRERLAEVRRLLDDPVLAEHPGVRVARGSAADGYRQWAPSYDEPNGLFDLDEPFVDEVLQGLPAGTALDAACGTGRLAERLEAAGHRVVGVDASAEMLARARSRVPSARFVQGHLERLPLPDASVDIAVCALALSHLPGLGGALAELARVLRPGGHLVISDVHAELVLRGSVVTSLGADGGPGLVPTYRHPTGAYLRAALAAGLRVRRCEEVGAVDDGAAPERPARQAADADDLGPWSLWPWSLLDLAPEASAAAWTTPSTVLWHFQRPDAAPPAG